MKKSKSQKTIELELARALAPGGRPARDVVMKEKAKKLFDFLSPDEKASVISNMEADSKKSPAEFFANEVIDSLKKKRTKLEMQRQVGLRKATDHDEELAVKRKTKIRPDDITHMIHNVESVKDSATRAKEVMLNAFRNSQKDTYKDFMKSVYETDRMKRVSTMMKEEIKYMGGTKNEGYTYHLIRNKKVWEIQTPGYDENQGRLHGFRYRELGSDEWIGG